MYRNFKVIALQKIKPPSRRYNTYKRSNFPAKVKIHYFLHPLYQKNVEVVDNRTFVSDKYYLIKFFDKIIYLPVWMTEPDYCSTLTISENPQCDLKALHKLRLQIDRIQF